MAQIRWHHVIREGGASDVSLKELTLRIVVWFADAIWLERIAQLVRPEAKQIIMSASGQKRQFDEILITSVFPLKATYARA